MRSIFAPRPDSGPTRWSASVGRTAAVLLIGIGMVVGCSSSDDDDDAPPLDDEPTRVITERLQRVLDDAVADGLPGVALSIRGTHLSFDGVAGVRDLAGGEPVDTDDRFYLASVGKTYTAVTVARLAEQGVLGLDDPIGDWLPPSITGRIPSSEAISVRDLLSHTSGIADFQNDDDAWSDFFIANPDRGWRDEDAIAYIVDEPLRFEPSTSFRYSNSNYVLAAMIAEAATGNPIATVIGNLLVEPLGLRNTLQGGAAVGVPGLVHGYVYLDEELLDVYPWYVDYGVSDGGMQASAADLASFVHALIAEERLLSAATREDLLTPSALGDPPSTYGLGVNILSSDQGDSFIYAHDGKDPGSRADFIHIENRAQSVHVTIALCANASLEPFDDIYDRTLSRVIEVLSSAETGERSR